MTMSNGRPIGIAIPAGPLKSGPYWTIVETTEQSASHPVDRHASSAMICDC